MTEALTASEAEAAIWEALTSPAGYGRYTAYVRAYGMLPPRWYAVVAWFTGEGEGLGDIATVELGPCESQEAARAAAIAWVQARAAK